MLILLGIVCGFLYTGTPGITFSAQVQGVLVAENANEARLNRLQPPEKVMDAIGVKSGMYVAEIGAGQGRYVVQLAVRVGEQGKVYAEDIDASALRHLSQRCEKWNLQNVQAILGEIDHPQLPPAELDVIFIISSYHHFDDPITLLKNARSALKPQGVLAIGEWIPREGHQGYNTPEQMEAQMKQAGYKLDRIETLLEKNFMYIYIFKLDSSF